MPTLKNEISKTLDDLTNQGESFFKKEGEYDRISLFEYQSWYTRAHSLIKQILPERLEEFQELYASDRDIYQKITVENYSIRDYILGLKVMDESGKDVINYNVVFHNKFKNQLAILLSIRSQLDSILFNMPGILKIHFLKHILDATKSLFDKGGINVAGAFIESILKEILSSMCDKFNIKVNKNTTIREYNVLLKNNKIIDIMTLQEAQKLENALEQYIKRKDSSSDKIDDLFNSLYNFVKKLNLTESHVQ